MEEDSTGIVTLNYQELVDFDNAGASTGNSNSNNPLLQQLQQAYGPQGLGILAVRHVPGFAEKRAALLPLAAKLPTLPDLSTLEDPASSYSIGWSHGKEEIQPGQPDVSKGSFYADPFSTTEQTNNNRWPDESLPQLRPAFLEMSHLLQQVARLVARLCDAYCHLHGIPTLHLERTVQTSTSSKGRLLHYFPPTADNSNNTWCAWHNDHGSLTGLVPGMYLQQELQEQEEVILSPDDPSGLYILPRCRSTSDRHFHETHHRARRISIPPDGCAFQIGEASQIQSGGLLQATPHAVLSSSVHTTTTRSRESFALFLQPNFSAPLSLPVGKTLQDCCHDDDDSSSSKLVPSLALRWKPGQIFGDFHLATIAAFLSAKKAEDQQEMMN